MSRDNLLALTAGITSSFLSNADVNSEKLPSVIRAVYETLSGIDNSGDAPSRFSAFQAPAVDPRKSVFPDYIVCLEDGRKLKMLKRYLMSQFGMTPEQYREKWMLPSTYPMVAPNYREKRSSLAKSSGLGRSRPR